MSTTDNSHTQSTLLPVVTVQPTFLDVITDVEDGIVPSDTFWVSCYKKDAESVHATIHAELDERDRNKVLLKANRRDVDIIHEERLTWQSSSPGVRNHASVQTYWISCASVGAPSTRVLTPRQEYRDLDRADAAKVRIQSLLPEVKLDPWAFVHQPHRITAFATAPDSTRYATGYLDGSVHIYPTTPSSPSPSSMNKIEFAKDSPLKCYSKAHLSTVANLKFFPSSRVLLSSGNDFTVNILSAELPSSPSSTSSTRVSPVRTLRGHTRPVTSTEILGVGRAIVSASLDSKLKLWDVPSGDAVQTLYSRDGSGIVATCSHKAVVENGFVSTGDETRVYAALSNGSVEVFDLKAGNDSTRGSVRSFRPASTSSSGSLTAISCSGGGANDGVGHLLACGTTSGEVKIFDLRSSLGAPLASFRRLDTGIASLAFLNGGSTSSGADASLETRLVVGTTDGLPYIVGVPVASEEEGSGTTARVWAELVGVDCDAVRHVAVNAGDGGIWTGSDDGIVRKY